MAYASEKPTQVNPYADPTPPPTAAQADYGNVVGNQNRADIGGQPIGNSQQGYEEVVQQQQRQDEINQQNQERQNQAVQAALMMDRLRALGFTGVPTGQSVYEHQMGIAPVQERTYLENLENRPRYTPQSQLGDTETQRRVAAGENVGSVLESQRKYAESTPGTRDDQYYLNELSKWNANAIETSSEYHHETYNTGVQQKANPYENRGDVALAFEKGGNLKDFEQDRYGFNKNVGEMIGVLPGGQGLQETAWGVAKSGRASNVDFQPAVDYQLAQEGRYGPYGSLYGGVVDKPVESPMGSTPTSQEPIGNARLAWGGNQQVQQGTPTGKEWNTFVASAAEPIGYISEGWQMPKREETPGTYIEPAKGDIFGIQIPVISNVVAFFQPESIKTVSQKNLPESANTEYTPIQETQIISKTPLPDKVITSIDPTTGETITTTIKGVQTDTVTYGGVMANTTVTGGKQTNVVVTPGLSGYDKLNQSVRDFLHLPSPEVGERATELASYSMLALPGAGPMALGNRIVVEGAKKLGFDTSTPEAAMKTVNPMSGQYTQFYEQPLLVPLSYAGGAAFGTVAKGVESVYGASRVAAAEQIISRGQTYRAAEQFSGFVMEKAPLVLGTMYGASIAERSTQGFTNFAPEQVVPKARSIVMQEAVPMGYGFNAPGQVVKTAQLSNLNYKAAVQEGATTGRFDYYVKQPVTKPIELVKQDYAAFMQENKPVLNPEQKIIQDVLDIQTNMKMGKVVEQQEDAFVWRQKTGDKIIEYQGAENSEISGNAMEYLRSRARVGLSEEEAIIVAHTHPYQSGDAIVPELISGTSLVLSGEIGAKSFVKESLSLPSDVLANKAMLSTPSPEDITALRFGGRRYGTTVEMAISPDKVAVYSTQAKTTIPTPDISGTTSEPRIQPKGTYSAWGSYFDAVIPEGIDKLTLLKNPRAHLASTYETKFVDYGRDLGFKADILTTAQLKAMTPKQPGVKDYLLSKVVSDTPVQLETNRNYIPHEGIENVAYPKQAERPVSQEPNRNYIPYEGIEQVAYPKLVAKTTAPESQRNYYEYEGIERDAYPINSVIITAKAKWQEWRTPERLLYFGSYGGQNVISQGLPPEGWGTTIGTRGAVGQSTRKDEGGTGGRISPKIVGGSQVSGLKPEQSMFKMGAETVSKDTTVPKSFGQRYDFRGQEKAPMKPMDLSQTKQSAIQIEMQEAPSRMPVPERVSQPQSFDYRILQVQQQDQEQGQQSIVGITPSYMSSQIMGQTQTFKQSQKYDKISEQAKGRSFDTVMRQMQRNEQKTANRSRQDITTTPSFITDQTIGQTSRQESSLIRTTSQKTNQKITTDYKPWEDTWSRRTTTPPPPIPGIPFLPGGGGGYGTKRRGRRFTELFPVGLYDSAMAGMRGKRLPKTKAKKGRLIPKKWGK